MIFFGDDLNKINTDLLYWLFAASSQSIAALFAVVGMFAVFRYQFLENRLRNFYDCMKNKFSTSDYIEHFGIIESKSWEDHLILDRVRELLKERESEGSDIIENNLTCDLDQMESHEIVRDNVLNQAKFPLVIALLTFICAIFFLPFAESITGNILGLFCMLLIVVLVSVSAISIFFYLIKSIPRRPNKGK